jgi:hypothetical protein
MVNRLDNDSSFSSFADYQLDDALFQHDDDSSTTSVDLANEVDSGIDDPRAYSHGDALLDESASGGSGDELFPTTVDYSKTTTTTTTTTTPKTTTTTTVKPRTMPKDRRRPARKTVRFGSEEIRYFVVLPDGQIHVTEHQVRLLPEQLLRQRPAAPVEEKMLFTIAEDRWRPFVPANTQIICARAEYVSHAG